jgi:hypothetical protein
MQLNIVPSKALSDFHLLDRLARPIDPDPKLNRYKFLLLDDRTFLMGPAYFHPYLVMLQYASREELEEVCRTLKPGDYASIQNPVFEKYLVDYLPRVRGAGEVAGGKIIGWTSTAFSVETPKNIRGPIEDTIQSAFGYGLLI